MASKDVHIPRAELERARDLLICRCVWVMNLAAQGLSNQTIARRLGKSEGWVRQNMLGRTDLTLDALCDIMLACGRDLRAGVVTEADNG